MERAPSPPTPAPGSTLSAIFRRFERLERFIRALGAAPTPILGGPIDSAQAMTKLQEIIAALRAAGINVGQMAQEPPAPATPRPTDLSALMQQVLQLLKIIAPSQGTGTAAPALESEQLRKILEIIQTIATIKRGGATPLGQVNGALGETLGKLLNGKKSAIGIIGALVTTLLSQVPATTGLGQVLAMLTPTTGLSQFTLPIFLALSAWGALGKLEKWSQGTAPPPKLPT